MASNNAKYTKTQGLTIQISNASVASLPAVPAPTYVDLSTTIKQVNQQGGQSTDIDVSVFASEEKETATGLPDPGTWALSGNWKAGDAGQQKLYEARASADPYAFKITYPDTTTVEAIGYVTQISADSAVNGVVNGSFNLRMSGKPIITPPEEG